MDNVIRHSVLMDRTNHPNYASFALIFSHTKGMKWITRRCELFVTATRLGKVQIADCGLDWTVEWNVEWLEPKILLSELQTHAIWVAVLVPPSISLQEWLLHQGLNNIASEK